MVSKFLFIWIISTLLRRNQVGFEIHAIFREIKLIQIKFMNEVSVFYCVCLWWV